MHAPELWREGGRLGLARTPDTVEYGTVAMAQAVAEVARRSDVVRVLVMGGHQDGVMAWGASADEAGEALLAAHQASACQGT